MHRSIQYAVMLMALLVSSGGAGQVGSSTAGRLVETVRLYVLDCGTHHIADPAGFSLTGAEVGNTDMAIACVLIAHPKGLLMWDAGAVPDSISMSTGAGVRQRVVPSDGRDRYVTVRKTLLAQLAEAGYTPRDVTYLALSHHHFDHTANANEFASSTWLVRQSERDAMFAEKPPVATQPSSYSALRNSKTTIVEGDYDVFGDGKVVLKEAPGHTPGHQSLYVKLANTGGVLLSGDLYHYHQSRTLQRVPKFDFDQEQSRATRATIEQFLRESGAQLWIQHDYSENAKLKKAPSYYD
jgi:glyoxylase-like metal-dependent hydrolase (beta-lactamase superfamily II)